MKSREILKQLESINMKEIFIDIIKNGELEDLKRFIEISGSNIARDTTNKKMQGWREIRTPLMIEDRHIIEVVVSRNKQDMYDEINNMIEKGRESNQVFQSFEQAYEYRYRNSINRIDITLQIVKEENSEFLSKFNCVSFDALSHAFFKKESNIFENLLLKNKIDFQIFDRVQDESPVKNLVKDIIDLYEEDPLYVKRFKSLCNKLTPRMHCRLLEIIMRNDSRNLNFYEKVVNFKKQEYGYFDDKTDLITFLLKYGRYSLQEIANLASRFPADYKNKEGKGLIEIINEGEQYKNARQKDREHLDNVKNILKTYEEKKFLSDIMNEKPPNIAIKRI